MTMATVFKIKLPFIYTYNYLFRIILGVFKERINGMVVFFIPEREQNKIYELLRSLFILRWFFTTEVVERKLSKKAEMFLAI